MPRPTRRVSELLLRISLTSTSSSLLSFVSHICAYSSRVVKQLFAATCLENASFTGSERRRSSAGAVSEHALAVALLLERITLSMDVPPEQDLGTHRSLVVSKDKNKHKALSDSCSNIHSSHLPTQARVCANVLCAGTHFSLFHSPPYLYDEPQTYGRTDCALQVAIGSTRTYKPSSVDDLELLVEITSPDPTP
ncbi:hypothetical protein M8818_006851 [Zalaria obscura]|uniref:Uncharacterized protein n=1 Tax=Zalaria obscura TaxID=2024903 RepID=A0ACC3S6X2_9PEZI